MQIDQEIIHFHGGALTFFPLMPQFYTALQIRNGSMAAQQTSDVYLPPPKKKQKNKTAVKLHLVQLLIYALQFAPEGALLSSSASVHSGEEKPLKHACKQMGPGHTQDLKRLV